MIGEVQRLLDQRVEVDRPALARDPARVFEHALDDAVGALAVLGDLVEVAAQHLDDLVDRGALVVAERRHGRRRRLLQLQQQFARQLGEIVDEIERVLDLVRDPGGQLAECRHLLGVQQARLRRLQFLQRALGGVARRADLGLGALALGDVAVDQHNPAARHRVAAHLDDPAIRARPLGRPLRPDPFRQPAHLRFDIDRAVFAMRGEVADKIGDARPLGEERIGEFEDPLEIQVPRGEPQLAVEHRHPVAHIVEGDAQLGLALADLVEQPGIVHRDHRLRGEAFEQRDLLVGERPHLLAVRGDDSRAARRPCAAARTGSCGRRRARPQPRAIGSSSCDAIGRQIGIMDEALAADQPLVRRAAESSGRHAR